MILLDLYNRCLSLNDKYEHTEIGGSYFIEEEGDTLYLFFQWSNGLTDWIFNLLFPRKKRQPYTKMDEPWRCHGGFLRVWDSIKPHIADAVADTKYKKVIIVGYSHGAPMAGLCHEYVWFNRPDLRDNLRGYGFGCPRFFGGTRTDSLAERWKTFYVICNLNDLVTHVPPKLFGFKHVGLLIEVGKRGNYNMIDAHRPASYQHELAVCYIDP